ncbi:MAG: hypothetical protein M3N47_01025 [Chloroflexota bacterium]|nr:hypothetical protein [Chloroflexota bacterium]
MRAANDPRGMMNAFRRRIAYSSRRRAVHAICAAGTTLALAAPSAQAEPAARSALPCPDQTLEQPFLPWHDFAHYVLAPQGTFETLTAWHLSGAFRVRDNETFYVHGNYEQWSLALPPGSSATSPAICVSVEHPVIRLFVRNAGSATSALRVEVLFKDISGERRAAVIGELVAGEMWAPTLQMPLLANGLALTSDNKAMIALRFTPLGLGGDWRIDDVYADPYRKG